jgi:hypothetical protein
MKMLLIIQMLLGIVLVAQEARSAAISCNKSTNEIGYRCFSDQHDFWFSKVRTPEIAEKTFELIDSDINFPGGGITIDYDTFVHTKSVANPRPLFRTWTLPAYTLLSLANKGIEKIQGRTIPDLIDESLNVSWDDFYYFDLINRFEPQRHTGFYNSMTDRVVYDQRDLKSRSLPDLQHWALHELFGTANIDDVDYELSTMAILVNQGDMTAEEFAKHQYNHTKLIIPLFMDSHLVPIAVEKPIEKILLEDKTKRDDAGGITGVEGGGDIVSASIKRYMLLALKQRQGGKPLSREQVSGLLKHDIHYTNYFDVVRTPRQEEQRYIGPLYLDQEDEQPILVLNESIRDKWPTLSESEKRKIGRRYNDFLKLDPK